MCDNETSGKILNEKSKLHPKRHVCMLKSMSSQNKAISHNNYQRNERGGGALAFSPTDYRVYFFRFSSRIQIQNDNIHINLFITEKKFER